MQDQEISLETILIRDLNQHKVKKMVYRKLYLNIDVISYYNSKNINIIKLNITYENDVTNNDENYKLIFRQPIRRIN